MISSITGIGGIRTVGGWHTNPHIQPVMKDNTELKPGDIRYNGVINKLECWDGLTWIPVSSGDVTVELTPDVQEVLNWAKNKMQDEKQIKELAEKHPSVASAVNQLDTIVKLLQDGEK